MIKRHFTALFLLILLVAFLIFININNKFRVVRTVITPTKIVLNSTDSKHPDAVDTYCIENYEAFSLEEDEDFISKYTKKYKLTNSDLIGLGYLAEEFAQKTLIDKRVSIKTGTKVSKECKDASIKIDGTDYGKLLGNSGFGIKNGEIINPSKFKQNLELARKQKLVVLNHHSNKYHTLDCPYGNIAHDRVILPQNQLPKDSIPCKYCHNSTPKKKLHVQKVPNIIQPPLQYDTGNITTYLTDYTKNLKPTNLCSTKACLRLLQEIDKSTTSIDMALYGYREVPQITAALKKAKDRGVKIRYIYDSYYNSEKNYYTDNEILINLSQNHRSDKTNSQTLSNMLMHNKFIIFDNKTVYTGSMNLSPTGTSGYDVNSVIVINSKEIAKIYTKEFEQFLNGKFHTAKIKSNENIRIKLNNSEIEIYFSPQDKPSTRIIELIKNAKSYIYIPTFLITHGPISEELISAHNRGVDVRVIIDANSVTSRNSKHAKLRKAGILLKTENYAGKLHAKTIIIDDTYLITGSMNFSNSGDNKNDENLLIIKNPTIAKQHKNFFLYLWTLIPNKYLHNNARPESPDSIGSCSDGIDNNFNNKIDKEEASCQYQK